MPIPPIGPGLAQEFLHHLFCTMGNLGGSRPSARVENLSPKEARGYQEAGLSLSERPPEMVYAREDLAGYRGDRYKSHRALVNRLLRERGEPNVSPYRREDGENCRMLFQKWSMEKKQHSGADHDLAVILLEDAESAHAVALSDAEAIGLRGWTFRLDKRLAAYSLGVDGGNETFVSLVEVCDPGIAGLSQWVTRETARRLERFRWLNAMDDSGLEGLARNKEGYHPASRIPLYDARLPE